jgi:hypothetical protein
MMNRHSQSGYMLEIPVIMFAAAILLALALPRLPAVFAKILVVVVTLVWIGGLYYMIVIPGWRPGNPSRISRVWRLTQFLVLAGLLSFAAGAYVVAG